MLHCIKRDQKLVWSHDVELLASLDVDHIGIETFRPHVGNAALERVMLILQPIELRLEPVAVDLEPVHGEDAEGAAEGVEAEIAQEPGRQEGHPQAAKRRLSTLT